jgi:predicted XRE-type DNA-binding protein
MFKKQINEVVKQVLKDRRIKVKELAEGIGLTSTYTSELLNGLSGKRWNDESLDKVLKFLGIEVTFKVKKRKSA